MQQQNTIFLYQYEAHLQMRTRTTSVKSYKITESNLLNACNEGADTCSADKLFWKEMDLRMIDNTNELGCVLG